MSDRLEKALRQLAQHLRRLQPEQGDRARRNARLRVKTKIRQLDAAIDQAFPRPTRKATKKVRKPRFSVVCNNRGCGAVYAREPAGGRCRACKNTSFSVKMNPKAGEIGADATRAMKMGLHGIKVYSAHGRYIVPRWANAIYNWSDRTNLDANLKRAITDLGWRKATLAAIALKEIGE